FPGRPRRRRGLFNLVHKAAPEGRSDIPAAATCAKLAGMNLALPLFHLYGDPPDDQAFDFIHIETISSRSSVHDWTIRAHRHRNLFQILLIERGGGEMTIEATTAHFAAPAAILLPATVAHGFRFLPRETEGWVVSFTEDVTHGLGGPHGEALARLRALPAAPRGPHSAPQPAPP